MITPFACENSWDGIEMNLEAPASIDAEGRGIDAALDRAFDRALEIGRQTGTPVWVMQDGKLVNLLADEQKSSEPNGDRSAG